jgi:hypothetical protein
MFGLAAVAPKGLALVALLLNRLLEPKALLAGAAGAPKALEVAGAGSGIERQEDEEKISQMEVIKTLTMRSLYISGMIP